MATRVRRTLAQIEADKNSATRVCRKCLEEKDKAEYRPSPAGDGLGTWCKNCLDDLSEEHRQENYELRRQQGRKRRLKCVYGITPEQYDELLLKQNNACAICLKPADSFSKNLAVDHDHHSGAIRGLLCTYCNHRLVARHRDGDLLRRIADYVEQDTGWYVPERKKKQRKRKRING